MKTKNLKNVIALMTVASMSHGFAQDSNRSILESIAGFFQPDRVEFENSKFANSEDYKKFQKSEVGQYKNNNGAAFVYVGSDAEFEFDQRILKKSKENRQIKYFHFQRETGKFGSKRDYCVGVLLSEIDKKKTIPKYRALEIADTTRLELDLIDDYKVTGRFPNVAADRSQEIINITKVEDMDILNHSVVFDMSPSSGLEYMFCSSTGEKGTDEDDSDLGGIEVRDIQEIMHGKFVHVADAAVDYYGRTDLSLKDNKAAHHVEFNTDELGGDFRRDLYVKRVRNSFADNCTSEISKALEEEKKNYENQLNKYKLTTKPFKCEWDIDNGEKEGNPDNWFGGEQFVTRKYKENGRKLCDGKRRVKCVNTGENAFYLLLDEFKMPRKSAVSDRSRFQSNRTKSQSNGNSNSSNSGKRSSPFSR